MGGLSKKAEQIKSIFEKNNKPFLLIDAGSLLFKGEQLNSALAEQDKVTAEGIVSSYNTIGYDAVNIALFDLAAGLDFFKDIEKQSKFSWLSANLVNKTNNKPIFKTSIIKKVGSIDIGIIGLTAISNSRQVKNKLADENATILEWYEVLDPLVTEIDNKSDMVVLLSNYNFNINRKIANRFKSINIIIQSGTTASNKAPEKVENTLIFQTDKQGKILGLMNVNWSDSGTWGSDNTAKQLKNKKSEMDGINGRLSRFRARYSEEELKQQRGYINLQEYKVKLSKNINELETALNHQIAAGSIPSTYSNRFIALEVFMPDDPEVLKIVEETKDKVYQIGKRASKKGNTHSSGDEDSQKLLVGWQSCERCHSSHTKFWENTRHAKAYNTLVRKKQNYNLKCLPCHVTYDRAQSPSLTLTLEPEFQLVGCEACHGPGNKHIINPEENRMTTLPPEHICVRCHTSERDDSFLYQNDLKLIACPEEG